MITYSATLDVPEDTATLLTALLVAERLRRGTGVGARAASARAQAILVLRWFRQDADLKVLAADTRISLATGYRYLHEGIDVLAAQAPDLHQVLERGKAAGWTHVTLDGTLIATDRCRTVNPDTGHDLWYSGKHRAHGGNVQIVSDPDGHPVAVSDVEPGSTHDLAAARATGFLGALHAAAALLGLPALADKGYDGRRCRSADPHQGRQPAPGQPHPQPAPRLPTRPRRTRDRIAQNPLEGAQPHPTVPSANRRHRQSGTRPDHRRTTNPLRRPHSSNTAVRHRRQPMQPTPWNAVDLHVQREPTAANAPRSNRRLEVVCPGVAFRRSAHFELTVRGKSMSRTANGGTPRSSPLTIE